MKKLALLIGILIFKASIFGAYAGNPLKLNDLKKSVKPFAALQLWHTYSWDNKVEGTTTDDRFGSYFRRARFGLKGRPMDRLYYNIQLSAHYLYNYGKGNNFNVKASENTKRGDMAVIGLQVVL
jgi:hypothetical protein